MTVLISCVSWTVIGGGLEIVYVWLPSSPEKSIPNVLPVSVSVPKRFDKGRERARVLHCKGRYLNDVRKIFGILDPLPPFVTHSRNLSVLFVRKIGQFLNPPSSLERDVIYGWSLNIFRTSFKYVSFD